MRGKQLLGVALFFLTLVPSLTFAATLSVSPATNTYKVGEQATVTIYVDSDASVNAVSGALIIPTDIFSVVSVSKSSSFMTFWMTDPAFSSADGAVHFEGVSPGSGYTGSHGTVVTITLRAKQVGTGSLTFDGTSQVLANDGNGTDIFSGASGAKLTVTAAASTPTRPVVTTPKTTPVTRPVVTTVVAPTVTLNEIPRTDLTNPVVTFDITGKDTASRIASYSVSVDSAPVVTLAATTTQYSTQALTPGVHTIVVTALDLAGNSGFATLSATTTALSAPVLSLDTARIDNVQTQIIRGTSSNPSAIATVYFEDNLTTALRVVTPTDAKGNFMILVSPDLRANTYSVRATITNSIGAVSNPSDPVALVIRESVFAFSPTVLIYGAGAFVLLLLLLAICFFVWRTFSGAQKLVSVRVAEMRESLHDQFKELKAAFTQEIQILVETKTKHALTIEEEQLLGMEETQFSKRFTHQLDASEEGIEKMIERVVKHL